MICRTLAGASGARSCAMAGAHPASNASPRPHDSSRSFMVPPSPQHTCVDAPEDNESDGSIRLQVGEAQDYSPVPLVFERCRRQRHRWSRTSFLLIADDFVSLLCEEDADGAADGHEIADGRERSGGLIHAEHGERVRILVSGNKPAAGGVEREMSRLLAARERLRTECARARDETDPEDG